MDNYGPAHGFRDSKAGREKAQMCRTALGRRCQQNREVSGMLRMGLVGRVVMIKEKVLKYN
jgi:hypothetical protein